MPQKYWLMKAEPDSRVVKGKDVKFSVDDFESVKTTPWEGVRNAEARNIMKEMKVGDKVLFYHSNCKTPGIAGFAEVSKEAYPDYTAWDSSHPYYDAKTDKANPKWYMVDVTFVSRTAHFVPLALLRRIAAVPTNAPPSDVEYIGEDGVKAIKQMALVTRGRLSVQRVDEKTWGVIETLAEKGGWEEAGTGAKTGRATKAKKPQPRIATKAKRKRAKEDDEDSADSEARDLDEPDGEQKSTTAQRASGRKRKARDVEMEGEVTEAGIRRSTRSRK